MHPALRVAGLIFLLIPALALPAHADFGDPGPANGHFTPSAPPPPPPRRSEQTSTSRADPAEQAPTDPRESAGILAVQLLGGTLGVAVNWEGRFDRLIVSVGVAAAVLGGSDHPDDDEPRFATPIALRYLVLTNHSRRHALEIGGGINPVWQEGYAAVYPSVAYRGEFDAFYVRGGMEVVGFAGGSLPPIPILPAPTLGVGARF